MKDSELISVIIPVYNVENYLKRCVDSVRQQTYTNLEIILVNDGSTDNSRKICEEYTKIDSRIKVVNKKNGGLSDARNAGIDIAQGKYLCFVDSDDWIAINCLEILKNNLIVTNADISVGQLTSVKRYEEFYASSTGKITTYINEKAVEEYLYQRISPSACGKLYKREIFTKLRYPKGKLFEDVEVTYLAIKAAERIVSIRTNIYAYFRRTGSIVTNRFRIEKMDYYYNTQKVLCWVKKDYPNLTKAAISRMVWAEIHLIVKMGNEREKFHVENEILWNDIKKYRKQIILDTKVRFANKIVMGMSYLGQKILCMIYQVTNL